MALLDHANEESIYMVMVALHLCWKATLCTRENSDLYVRCFYWYKRILYNIRH